MNIEALWKTPERMDGTIIYQFQKKIRYLKMRIKEWNIKIFINVEEEKKRLKKYMETLQNISWRE